MKIEFITFIVPDLAKEVEFYEKVAGLHEVNRMKPPIGEIVFMANGQGQTCVELIQPVVPIPHYEGVGMTMAFSTEADLKPVRQAAIDMGLEPTEIDDRGPEPVNFKVKDFAGIMVEFCNE